MTPSARTLGGVFALRASKHAGRTAVVTGRRVLVDARRNTAAAAFAAAVPEMGIGHDDRIAARGTTIMRGDARMPGGTARSFPPEGSFLPGVPGEEGGSYVVGRRRDAILRGGIRILPREGENPFRTHPAVDDARMTGRPGDVPGEPLSARVVPVEGVLVTAGEIPDLARDVLAARKVPDVVRFLDASPVTGTGGAGRRALASAIALETTPS